MKATQVSMAILLILGACNRASPTQSNLAIREPVSYMESCGNNDLDPDSVRVGLCPQEARALTLALAQQPNSIIGYFERAKKETEQRIQNIKATATKEPEYTKGSMEMLRMYYSMVVNVFANYDEAMKAPEADPTDAAAKRTCLFKDPKFAAPIEVYKLCQEYRLIEKIKSMSANRKSRNQLNPLSALETEGVRFSRLAANLEARLHAYRVIAEQGLAAIDAGVILPSDVIATPYLALIGTPQDYLNLLKDAFQLFSSHVREGSSYLSAQKQSKTEVLQQGMKAKEQGGDMLNLGIDQKSAKNRRSNAQAILNKLHAERKALESEKQAATGRLKAELSNLVNTNLDPHIPASNVQNVSLDLLGNMDIDVSDATMINIAVLNRPEIVANGVFQKRAKEVNDALEYGNQQYYVIDRCPDSHKSKSQQNQCDALVEQISKATRNREEFYAYNPMGKPTDLNGYVTGESLTLIPNEPTPSSKTASYSGGLYNTWAPAPELRLGMLIASCKEDASKRQFPIGLGNQFAIPAECKTLSLRLNDRFLMSGSGGDEVEQYGQIAQTCGPKSTEACIKADTEAIVKYELYRNIATEVNQAISIFNDQSIQTSLKNIAFAANPLTQGYAVFEQAFNAAHIPLKVQTAMRPLIEAWVADKVIDRQIMDASQREREANYNEQWTALQEDLVESKIAVLKSVVADQTILSNLSQIYDSYLSSLQSIQRDAQAYYLEEWFFWLNIYVKSYEYHHPRNKEQINKLKERLTNFEAKAMAHNKVDAGCDAIKLLSAPLAELCRSSSDQLKASEFDTLMEQFIYDNALENKVSLIVNQDHIVHCETDFKSLLAARYGTSPSQSVSQSLKGDTKSGPQFFVPTNDPRFDYNKACQILPPGGYKNQCLLKTKEAQKAMNPALAVGTLKGYYELTFETYINEFGRSNTYCDMASTADAVPRIASVGFEWSGSRPQWAPEKVYLLKSPLSWWTDESQESYFSAFDRKSFLPNIAGLAVPDANQPREVSLSYDFENAGFCRAQESAGTVDRYLRPDCIKALVGDSQSLSGNYQFRSVFFNARPGNLWTLVIPVFAAPGSKRTPDYEAWADGIENLKMHMYLQLEEPRH